MGKIPGWPSTSVWGGVAGMLDAYRLSFDYGDAPQNTSWFNALVCGIVHSTLCVAKKNQKMNGCHSGLGSTVGSMAGR